MSLSPQTIQGAESQRRKLYRLRRLPEVTLQFVDYDEKSGHWGVFWRDGYVVKRLLSDVEEVMEEGERE